MRFSCLLNLQNVICLTVHKLLSQIVFNPDGRLCHFLTFFLLQVWIFWNQATRPISQLNGRHILFGESFLVASKKMRKLCLLGPQDIWNFQPPKCASDYSCKRAFHRCAQSLAQFSVNQLNLHTFPSHSQKHIRILIWYHRNKRLSQE